MKEHNPGFKLTSAENWREPDPLIAALIDIDKRDGKEFAVQGTDWINYLAKTPLDARVPKVVWDAYHFAIGAVGYAYFYYPLFTMVAQQVLRVADFAIDQLFAALEKPRPHSLARRLETLHEEGYLSESDSNRWDGIRRLRNASTHPAWQENWGHGMSLQMIEIVALAISALPWPDKERLGSCD